MKKVNIVSDFFNTQPYLSNTFNLELRRAIIQELLTDQISNKMILDIGCGDGTLSAPFMDSNKVFLIDSAQSMLEKAKDKINLIKPKFVPTILEEDFLTYSFKDKFDLILCIGVVAHIENIESLLIKISSLLEFSGYAIIQISDSGHRRYKDVTSSLKGYGYELNRTEKTEFIDKLQINGFKLKAQSGYSWSFFPINRLRQKYQFRILNIIRKVPFFNFLSSEWLFLLSNKEF